MYLLCSKYTRALTLETFVSPTPQPSRPTSQTWFRVSPRPHTAVGPGIGGGGGSTGGMGTCILTQFHRHLTMRSTPRPRFWSKVLTWCFRGVSESLRESTMSTCWHGTLTWCFRGSTMSTCYHGAFTECLTQIQKERYR